MNQGVPYIVIDFKLLTMIFTKCPGKLHNTRFCTFRTFYVCNYTSFFRVNFQTDKLEIFNWNHMDHYVVTRGDREYVLRESLKYWRYRLMAIPLNHYVKTTKKIMENVNNEDFWCDIYEPFAGKDTDANMTKGFTRFLELYLNRIKRSPIINPKQNQLKTPQRPSSGLREHRANTISVDRSQLVHSRFRNPSGHQGSFVNSLGLGTLSPDSKGSNSSMDQSHIGSFEAPPIGISSPHGEDDVQEKEKLNLTSALFEICEAMAASKTGLTFINKAVPEMPPLTFVAFEAVIWIMENVEGVDSENMAMKIIRNLQDKRYICHASGNPGL